MKFFLAVLLLAFAHLTFARKFNTKILPMHEEHYIQDKCDYQCSLVDVPVCAQNGQCMQLFLSRCALSSYNCKHPNKPFEIIEDWRCEQNGAPLCVLEDRLELGL